MVFQLGKQAVFMRLGHFLRRRAVQQRLELPQRAFREGQTRCFEQQKGFDRTVLPQFFERTDTEPVQGGDGLGASGGVVSMVYSPKNRFAASIRRVPEVPSENGSATQSKGVLRNQVSWRLASWRVAAMPFR